jgi:hypothetical protein
VVSGQDEQPGFAVFVGPEASTASVEDAGVEEPRRPVPAPAQRPRRAAPRAADRSAEPSREDGREDEDREEVGGERARGRSVVLRFPDASRVRQLVALLVIITISVGTGAVIERRGAPTREADNPAAPMLERQRAAEARERLERRKRVERRRQAAERRAAEAQAQATQPIQPQTTTDPQATVPSQPQPVEPAPQQGHEEMAPESR